MKKILRISLLLIIALGIMSVTSRVNAKNYGVKTIYLKVGESVTLGQKNSKLAPDIPYEDKSGLGYIANGQDLRNYTNGAFKVEIGKETKDRTIKITGVKSGNGTLIVKFYSSASSIISNKISFKIDISNVPVKDVEVTTKNIELKPNESKQLAASISPSNATNKKVSWSILRGGEYVSVTTSGRVTAKNVKNSGEALIQVTTEDNNKSAACTVKVNVTNTTKTSASTTSKTNTTKTSTSTATKTNTTTNSTSRHNTSIKPQIGNEYLQVNDKIKFTATSWYIYSNNTLAVSTIKTKTLKNGDVCIVKSINGNAVEVTDENKKDIGYIYWNNTSTGAKSNFQKVSSGSQTTNKSTQKTSTEDTCYILKLFSSILEKMLPTAIEATKTIATSLIEELEEKTKTSETSKTTEKTTTANKQQV